MSLAALLAFGLAATASLEARSQSLPDSLVSCEGFWRAPRAGGSIVARSALPGLLEAEPVFPAGIGSIGPSSRGVAPGLRALALLHGLDDDGSDDPALNLAGARAAASADRPLIGRARASSALARLGALGADAGEVAQWARETFAGLDPFAQQEAFERAIQGRAIPLETALAALRALPFENMEELTLRLSFLGFVFEALGQDRETFWPRTSFRHPLRGGVRSEIVAPAAAFARPISDSEKAAIREAVRAGASFRVRSRPE